MIPSFDYEYVTYEELYKAYLSCRRRKRHSINAANFEVNLTENLYRLWIELNRKEYQVGQSIVFIVDKPVKREVFAADFRDRIIHHLIINRIMPAFESEVIENTFSCRKGKGTLCAIKTLESDMRAISENYTKDAYVLKCDLKSFFMTINKVLLFKKIELLVRERVHNDNEKQANYLCWLVGLVIMDEPQKKCKFKHGKNRWVGLPKEKSLFNARTLFGIPIGNLTSQIFANYFLNDFDHFVMNTLLISFYGRYVDDFYLLSTNKDYLISCIKKMNDKLKDIGIILHPNKIYIQNVQRGVKFVGGIIKPHRTYISNRTINNLYSFLHKCYIYSMNNDLSTEDIFYFRSSINSYFGFMKHHNTFNIRKRVGNSVLIKKWLSYGSLEKNLLRYTIFKYIRQTHRI